MLGTEILWQHSLVIYGLFLLIRTSSCRQVLGIALGYAIEGPFLGSSQMAVVSMFDKDAAPAVIEDDVAQFAHVVVFAPDSKSTHIRFLRHV